MWRDRWIGLACGLPVWGLVLWIEMSGHQDQLINLTRTHGFSHAVETVAPRLNKLLRPGVLFQGATNTAF
ncbi:MAG: hypothetical protein R3B96_22600 [Pirellulaceae bacterium]